MQAIEIFLRDNESFPELAKFKLSDAEWDALTIFQDIMKVCYIRDSS